MNETMVPLPPKRDLDPHRQAALRADLVADILAGRRQPGLRPVAGGRGRRWLMPVTAAAAVVLLAIGIGATVHSASTRTAPPAAARVDRLTKDCRAAGKAVVASYAEAAHRTGRRVALAPGALAHLPLLRVINSARVGTSTYAVLRYRDTVVFCRATRGATPPATLINAMPFQRSVRWLPTKVAVTVPGTVLMGLSASDVRKIAITASTGKVDQVVPVNGAWIAPNRFGQAPGVWFHIRGYDRHGAVIFDSLSLAAKVAAVAPCLRIPDGTVIFYPRLRNPDTSKCAKAIAWP
jgi:hypothetical protein